MTIVVTGATGYIGKEFIRAYGNIYKIIAFVRVTSDTSGLQSLNCQIRHYKNFKEIDKFFKNTHISGIIHFASNIVIEHSIDDIENLLNSNIAYGIYLLESCKKNGVKWFLNTGTFWQNYESKHYNPVNLYAATKESFQTLAKYYTESSNLIFTTIKLNDTFGPNDTRSKIFNLWDNYSKSGALLNMSQGEQIIDISYIEDVINAFFIMIKNLESSNYRDYNNKSYIVCSQERMTLKELSKFFEHVTKRTLNINWGGRSYREREVMVPYKEGELVPGWRQQYSLKEAIQKTIGRE